MKAEMIIGLLLFAAFLLYLINFLIQQQSKKVKQKRIKAIIEYKARRVKSVDNCSR